MAFSPDGKAVLTGSRDKTARGSGTPPPASPSGHLEHKGAGRGRGVQPRRQGRTHRQHDRTAQLWDAATGKPIGPPLVHEGGVRAVAFSPDGKAVLTAAKTTRRGSGTPPRASQSGHGWSTRALYWPWLSVRTAISYSRVVMTERRSSGLHRAGKPIGPLHEHQGMVSAVAFSPDGKAVITGSRTTPGLDDHGVARRLAAPITTWVEVVTGLELDEQGSVRMLDNAAWRKRRERLDRGRGTTGNGRGSGGSTPSSSAPNPRPAHGPGSSESGGPRPKPPSTNVVLAQPFDSDVLLERAPLSRRPFPARQGRR